GKPLKPWGFLSQFERVSCGYGLRYGNANIAHGIFPTMQAESAANQIRQPLFVATLLAKASMICSFFSLKIKHVLQFQTQYLSNYSLAVLLIPSTFFQDTPICSILSK
ncbi:MAG: hypothetical protein WAN11_05430, partial [Syntrophobacteraceae bacterium]